MLKLVLVESRDAGEQLLPFRQKVDFHHALVGASGSTLQQSQLRAAIDQGDHAVVMRLQPVCEFADRGPVAPREAHDVQQQLVLERREPPVLAQLLAESQEASQPVTEAGQALEVGLAEAGAPGGSRG